MDINTGRCRFIVAGFGAEPDNFGGTDIQRGIASPVVDSGKLIHPGFERRHMCITVFGRIKGIIWDRAGISVDIEDTPFSDHYAHSVQALRTGRIVAYSLKHKDDGSVSLGSWKLIGILGIDRIQRGIRAAAFGNAIRAGSPLNFICADIAVGWDRNWVGFLQLPLLQKLKHSRILRRRPGIVWDSVVCRYDLTIRKRGVHFDRVQSGDNTAGGTGIAGIIQIRPISSCTDKCFGTDQLTLFQQLEQLCILSSRSGIIRDIVDRRDILAIGIGGIHADGL